jgi:hypothetical protein
VTVFDFIAAFILGVVLRMLFVSIWRDVRKHRLVSWVTRVRLAWFRSKRG